MCPAAAPAAFRPCASVAPAASAAAFFAAPASSTPTGSFDCSQTTPARVKTCASACASSSLARGRDERGARVDHLLRVRGTADARHALARRSARSARASAAGRAAARAPWRPRRRRCACRDPPAPSSSITSASAARGHRQEDVVRARDARRGRLDAQRARQLDAGQVALVLALLLDHLRLLVGARLQRRAQAAAREQHRQRGAEGARADDGRPASPPVSAVSGRAGRERPGWE